MLTHTLYLDLWYDITTFPSFLVEKAFFLVLQDSNLHLYGLDVPDYSKELLQ